MSGQSREAVVSSLSQDPRVQAALLDYFARVDRGERVDPKTFLSQHADVSHELRSLISIDEEARRLAGAASPPADSPPASSATASSTTSKAEVSTHSVVGKAVETMVGQQKPAPTIQAPTHAAVGPVEEPVPDKPKPTGPVANSVASRQPSASDGIDDGARVADSYSPQTPADLPTVFGRYRVKKKLGEGAMGAVYLAEDSLLQRKVALKTPTFENDQDGELLRRFHREARAVANLKHPNLCAIYDVGEIGGRHYISMEFVPGRKLQEFIKSDKPLAEKQVMSAVRKIALAMQEAHTLGVIHRDLKPDNIMVNEKGEPVVMDFGLVHKTERKSSTKITKHGTLVGSPAYMSKEQVEGDPDRLTCATDQYSLGVILYQLLTSKLPFEGGIHAMLGAILTRQPTPPSQHRPDINPHLEAVCRKMMAKEAGDRYPSMKAVAEALAEVVRGTSTAAGASVPARPVGGSPSDAALETTFDYASVTAPERVSDFESNLLNERLARHKTASRARSSLPPRAVLIGGLAAGLVLLFAGAFWFRSGMTTGDNGAPPVKLENSVAVAKLDDKALSRPALNKSSTGHADADVAKEQLSKLKTGDETSANGPGSIPSSKVLTPSNGPSGTAQSNQPTPVSNSGVRPTPSEKSPDSIPALKTPAPPNGPGSTAPPVQPTPAPKAGLQLADARPDKLLIAGGRHSWALTEDNKKIVTGTVGGDVELWDVETGTKLHTFPKHDERVASIACSPSELHIAFIAGYATGNIRRLDLSTLTSEQVYTLGGVATNLSVSSDDKRVLVATGGGSLDIFDAKSSEYVEGIPGARAPACFRPDDANVVFFTRKDSTNTITEWSLTQRKEVRRYKTGTPGFSSVAVSADGQRVAGGCGHVPYANGKGRIDQVHVWSTVTGDKLATLAYETTKFGSSVAFSSDGTSVWASGATTVQFDVATGERLSVVNLSGIVQCFKDGRRVLISDSSGIHLYRLREIEKRNEN